MRLMPVAVVTTLALCGASVASAQSLAEAAAKERARRKGKVTKVVTDYELRGAGRAAGLTSLDGGGLAPETPAEGAPAGETPAAAGNPAQTLSAEDQARQDALREANQKAWRQRLQQATAQVTALESEIQLLENATGDLSGNIYSPSRAQQTQRLETARGELETARKSLEGVQDEGRRNSFTPGD